MAEAQNISIRLESLLSKHSPEYLQNFFVEELNFNPFNENLLPIITGKYREEVFSLKAIARQDEFYIIICEIKHLLKGDERPIAEKIEKNYPHALVVFTNPEHSEWHFTNIKHIKFEKEGFERKVRPFRRIIVGKTERLRTAAERISLLEVGDADSAIVVHEKCNKVFDVGEVTKEFYRDFVFYYKEFRGTLKNKNRLNDIVADTLTQNIFNRLFFLYYIQKKNFLSENPTYLHDNFKNVKGEYYKDFLLPLFKKLSDPGFKDKRFGNIPFLNGGLFEFNPIEDKLTIPNQAFKAIFDDLLERYNFTVREDTEFEQEVAIDPEMLGTIFEQLVLSLEKAKYEDIPDARRGTGSYYTPKFIVAFMVKQSLLNFLTELLPEKRVQLKELVFNLKTDGLTRDEQKSIKDKLLTIKIVDPGVGSGAFPVDILLKMVEIIDRIDRNNSDKEVESSDYRYNLKRKIIENNIYGVDIQSRAVNLANLRLWLSLIVDLNVKNIKDIPPLPNLDYHVIEGDSLISKIGDFDLDIERFIKPDKKGFDLLDSFISLKKGYERLGSKTEKDSHKIKIEKAKKDLLVWLLEQMRKSKEKELYNLTEGKLFKTDRTLFTEQDRKKDERLREEIQNIREHIKNVDTLLKTFNWGLDFFEVLEMNQGFDIVIGNPPYGVDVTDNVKNDFRLGSKDSYGAFTALGLKILRPGGTLCFIMSNTWQTIRTHNPLRDKLLSETDCQHLISCPSETFSATVNVGVYTFKKRTVPKEGGENWILAADFSPLSIDKGELESAFDILIEQIKFDDTKDGYTIWSDRDMAIFAYRQKFIARYSNHSFFIASPKLFALMRDIGNVKNLVRREDEPLIYSVDFNGKELELIKLGDIADTPQGIATGETARYIHQEKNIADNYPIADASRIVTPEQLRTFTDKERFDGIDPKKTGGRTLVPYDKGGASNTSEGWLPCYYVPLGYYIDWSKTSVQRMKTITKGEKNKELGLPTKPADFKKLASRLQNLQYAFRLGLTYSMTGMYAPTFRVGFGGLFDVKSPMIFSKLNSEYLLGLLNSKFIRYLAKTIISHGVDFSNDPVKNIPLSDENKFKTSLCILVNQIIAKQKNNSFYDYITNEQVEIDKLVYKIYNLDADDIKEVEDWFFRRYPKLSEVIEEKIKYITRA